MMTAVAAGPSLPSSSTLRKVLVRTSLTSTLESVRLEKSPAKSRPRSFSIGVRFFSYFTSNLGRLSLVEYSLSSSDFPLMTFGWKTLVFQLEQSLSFERFIFYFYKSHLDQLVSLSGRNTRRAKSAASSGHKLQVSYPSCMTLPRSPSLAWPTLASLDIISTVISSPLSRVKLASSTWRNFPKLQPANNIIFSKGNFYYQQG